MGQSPSLPRSGGWCVGPVKQGVCVLHVLSIRVVQNVKVEDESVHIQNDKTIHVALILWGSKILMIKNIDILINSTLKLQ